MSHANLTPVTLYHRADCHLCDEAESMLARLASRYAFSLSKIDVMSRQSLAERYGERVPVVVVGDQEITPPLSHATLERALAAQRDVAAPRAVLDRVVVGVMEPLLEGAARHWLLGMNVFVALMVAGAVAAPLLLAVGADALAAPLYDFYRAMCHQWAFRTFFLQGPSTVYSRDALAAAGADPYGFLGDEAFGWKMAFCERDLAIFLGLLLFGILYGSRWRRIAVPPAPYLLYGLLIVPMALDGFTQLFGWRESTWELRMATGLLFGLATAWLLYPRFQRSFDREIVVA